MRWNGMAGQRKPTNDLSQQIQWQNIMMVYESNSFSDLIAERPPVGESYKLHEELAQLLCFVAVGTF